ncbi:MAG: AAA family ATPase [Candidatus Thiodiazotropha sp. (ex Myrtea sp. 'scaly one' KF741663)]|nr:AAA family ATPase [Candidatus Thiodiazotropha sp. (ex Myrtea sp. 'scaly one' KF741663)]
MIINSIKASNVLKYASLELDNIPEQGLIAITGPNESGKSTIGETVCFALFGRTFSLDFDELPKIIRWDETHCSAELEFTPADGKRYHLERFLDDGGNHSARLALAESPRSDEPLARGIEQVADKVYELIGYEYEEFIESFYLAQREITTPHPHSYAVKTMAGLVTLEYCAEACREDHEETRSEVEAKLSDITKLQEQLDELDIDPRLLSELEGERETISRRMGEANRSIETLDSASVAYQDALPKREKAIGARGRAGFLRLIMLLLALVMGGSWYLLANMPAHDLSQQLSELLATSFSFWQPEMVTWLLYAAAGAAVLFLFFWMRRASLSNSVKDYGQSAQSLASVLDDLPIAESPETSSSDGVGEQEGEQATDSTSRETEKEEPIAVDRAARSRLSQRISDWQATIAEVRDGVGNEQNFLRQGMEVDKLRMGQLDQALTQERERLDKSEQLHTMQTEIREKTAERERHIEICSMADELIQGATREVSYQFNRKLRGLVSKTLPLFTENRYEHLQIDDDLSVRAFSSEKRDFMDLDEISSGTQRQIMLAVRLALSQELVERTVKGNQFLFLDEPFAFFDEHRTRSALTVLPTLSEELNQIWIIGQAFSDDLKFDRHIQCERSRDSIV